MPVPRLATAVLTIALAGCTSAGARAALSVPVIDTLPGGIVRVHNTGPTLWADTTGWALVLERTIAPGPGEPGELSEPRDIVADSQGRIYVVDRDPEITIKRYAADGSYLGHFGRKGSGPGEFENATLMITHDTLVIHDSRQSRTSTFTTDGDFIRVWSDLCCFNRPLLASNAGLVPIPGTIAPDTTDGDGAPMFAGSGAIWYRLDGTVRDTMFFPDEPEQPVWRMGDKNNYSINTIPFQPGLVGRFGPDGRFTYGLQSAYRLLVSASGRDTVRIFEYAADPAPLPDSLRQQAVDDYIRQDPRWKGVARLEDIPTSYPLWSNLGITQLGETWVLLPGPRGEGDHFDVFDRQGILLGQVPAPFSQLYRTYWGADRIYQVTENETTDLPEIRIWRIDRRVH